MTTSRAGLELLVGPERYPRHLARALSAFAIGLVGLAGLGVPALRWVIVAGVSALAAGVLVWILGRVEELASAETRARCTAEASSLELQAAYQQLAELNRTLEARVDAQVGEIEGLTRLRRFLSTPVADAVISSERPDLLQPHRRRIAVFFCDLRGFTAFSSSAQPEEVGDVLAEYFALLGAFVRDYEATVGAFTGDGLMAFFNDPLQVDQPALRAISMAAEVSRRWRTCASRGSCGATTSASAWGWPTATPTSA